MAWSSVYSAAGATDADAGVFWSYFLDEYLNGREEWAVSAHPNGDDAYRSIGITLPNLWNGGSNATSYFWVRMYNGAGSNTPRRWTWYADRTYTSVPGDLGTFTSTVWSMGSNWYDFGGSWRIWQSDLNPKSILVTKGKFIAFYWSGPDKWLLREDPLWDGSYANKGCQVGPYTGHNYEGLMQSGYPSSVDNFNSYALMPDVGGSSVMTNQNAASEPAMMAGVGWISSELATTNFYPAFSSNPILPRTDVDCLVWLPGANASRSSRYIASSSSVGMVLYNTSADRYYLAGNQDLTKRFMLWDMGTTEPDLS